MAFKAEYIWTDGTEPTPSLRSKTKVLPDGTTDFPIWGFDGSSTNQAPGDNSDCVLKPVYTCPDPISGGDNVLVMCEVFNCDGTVHATNHRAKLRELSEKFGLLQNDPHFLIPNAAQNLNHFALFGSLNLSCFCRRGGA